MIYQTINKKNENENENEDKAKDEEQICIYFWTIMELKTQFKEDPLFFENRTNKLVKSHANPKIKIERAAPGIMDRESISEPIHTGTKVIDALIPVGRGQRELVLGDRNNRKNNISYWMQ